MESESANTDAHYVRGLCFYYNGNLDEGINIFGLVLTLNPGHSKASAMQLKAKEIKNKKEQGDFQCIDLVHFSDSLRNTFCIRIPTQEC